VFPTEASKLTPQETEREVALGDVLEASPSSGILAYSAPDAARNPQLVKLVSHIFNESFGYRPDGRPYRLGPKSVAERLQETDYLFVSGDECSGIGYLFGKQIPSSQGRIAWIESMAVLPLYRRRGVAMAMLRHFCDATKGSALLGCATPNPIAALVVSQVVPGTLHIGPCKPPSRLLSLLRGVRHHCFDLRGCFIDDANFTIKTGFSPLSRSDEREWNPRTPEEPPSWWSWVQHLPNEFEALLLVERREEKPSLHSLTHPH
jgi:GNAT superfamily N-acetyltransferase